MKYDIPRAAAAPKHASDTAWVNNISHAPDFFRQQPFAVWGGGGVISQAPQIYCCIWTTNLEVAWARGRVVWKGGEGEGGGGRGRG